jgi:hypothetical protein
MTDWERFLFDPGELYFIHFGFLIFLSLSDTSPLSDSGVLAQCFFPETPSFPDALVTSASWFSIALIKELKPFSASQALILFVSEIDF